MYSKNQRWSIKLLLDEEERLHAQKKPRMQFSDAFSVYLLQGKIMSVSFPDDEI
jgi:hypothetical protein